MHRRQRASVPYIVDIDDSIGEPRPRLRISIDQDRLEFFEVEQRDVYDTIQALFGGTAVGYSHRGEGPNPIEIVVATDRFVTRFAARTILLKGWRHSEAPIPPPGSPPKRHIERSQHPVGIPIRRWVH
jgi:Cu/Ag efflux pump CusA